VYNHIEGKCDRNGGRMKIKRRWVKARETAFRAFPAAAEYL
jgi:hypothetical protein